MWIRKFCDKILNIATPNRWMNRMICCISSEKVIQLWIGDFGIKYTCIYCWWSNCVVAIIPAMPPSKIAGVLNTEYSAETWREHKYMTMEWCMMTHDAMTTTNMTNISPMILTWKSDNNTISNISSQHYTCPQNIHLFVANICYELKLITKSSFQSVHIKHTNKGIQDISEPAFKSWYWHWINKQKPFLETTKSAVTV